MKNGNLIRAIAKVRHFNGKEWCGYFTPSEIIALLEDGAKPVPHEQYQIQYAIECIKKGDGSRRWFYFYLGKTKPNQYGGHYGKPCRAKKYI